MTQSSDCVFLFISLFIRSAPSSESAYLTKGETYTVKVSGTGKYSLVVTKKAQGVVKFSSSSGKMEDRPKAVGFSFTGNQEYARDIPR
jgi:hypothetical protein